MNSTDFVFEGCSFKNHRTLKTSIDWRCSRVYSLKCKKSFKTTLDLHIINSSGSHNHDVGQITTDQQPTLAFLFKESTGLTITTAVQETTPATSPLVLHQPSSQTTSSVQKKILVDPAQCECPLLVMLNTFSVGTDSLQALLYNICLNANNFTRSKNGHLPINVKY